MNTENRHTNNDIIVFFAQCIESANRMAEQFTPLIINLQETLKPLVTKAIKVVEHPDFFKQLLQFARGLEELPARTQKALLILGRHGWFFDCEMWKTELWNIEEALSTSNVEGAENVLIEYFSERLDTIENSIIGRFRHREKIIRSAFSAHRREEYELSIPAFFAQTDGICKDVVGCYFFIKQKGKKQRDKKPDTATYVEQIASDIFWAALLQPLAQTLPINLSEDKRDKDFNELNRHMVLHGESLDYGTKINSLKAISLVNYVACMLPMVASENEYAERKK